MENTFTDRQTEDSILLLSCRCWLLYMAFSSPFQHVVSTKNRRSPFFALSPDAWCLYCIVYIKKRGRGLLRLLFFVAPYFLLLPLGLVLCVNVGLPFSLEFLRSSIEKEVGQQPEIHKVFSSFILQRNFQSVDVVQVKIIAKKAKTFRLHKYDF